MTRAAGACPREEHLRRLVSSELDGDLERRVREHVSVCSWCHALASTLQVTSAPASDAERQAADRIRDRLAGKIRARRPRPPEPEATRGASAKTVAALLRAERVQCLGWLAAEGLEGAHPTVLGARAEARAHDEDILSQILDRKQHEPTSPDAWHPLAIYHLMSGCRAGGGVTEDLARARRTIGQAGQLGLDPAVVANERGVILLNEGRAFEAAASFLDALRLAPTLPVARANLALVASTLGLAAIAPDLWSQALALAERSGGAAALEAAAMQAALERQRLVSERSAIAAQLANASAMNKVRIARDWPALAHAWLSEALDPATSSAQASELAPVASYLETVAGSPYLPAMLARAARDGGDDDAAALEQSWRSALALARGGQLRDAEALLDELVATAPPLDGLVGRALVLRERVRRQAGFATRPDLLERAVKLLAGPVFVMERARALRALASSVADERSSRVEPTEAGGDGRTPPVAATGRLGLSDSAHCLQDAVQFAQRAAELFRRVEPQSRGPVLIELAELLLDAGSDSADLLFREAAAHEELVTGRTAHIPRCIAGRIAIERAREWPSVDALERLADESASVAREGDQPVDQDWLW